MRRRDFFAIRRRQVGLRTDPGNVLALHDDAGVSDKRCRVGMRC
jgi:hypothetical protein